MASGNKSNSIRIADVVGIKVNVNNIKREALSKVKAAVASSTVKTSSSCVAAAASTVSSTVKDAKPGKERVRSGAQKASSSSSPSSSAAASSSSSSLPGKTAATKVCQVKDEARASSSSSSSAANAASIAAAISSSSAGSSSSIADQSFTAADSNSNIPSKSQAPCKVCGDKASGYHYGVTSCEGCKGFFRRSIQKQIEYRCLRDGKCVIIRLNRNRCQYCRFRKCLAVGMSRDSVRYGRVPKRPKEKNEERVTQAEADQSEKDSENKQVVTYDIILTIANAHHANCPFTEERLTGLVRKPAQFNLGEVDMNEDTAHSLEQQKLIMWEQFALYVTPSVQPIVEFAKKIPGFSELVQDDQLILIKSGFFEIWLVQISRMIDPTDNTLTFSDGSYVSTQQLDLIFDHDFISSIFAFGAAFNNLHLNDTEIGILSAIVLLTTDRVGLTDTKHLRLQQDKLREAMRYQLNRHHQSDTNLLSNLIEKLPELRTLGNKHNEHLKWFRVQWSRLKLPPLFAEIFDIPKYDERL